LQSATRTGTE